MGKSKDLATLKSGLSIDGTLETTSVGTNLTSNSYNIVRVQTDKDDTGGADGILQFTHGSSNTVKGEIRYDASESMFEFGHGDNQGHVRIDGSGRVTTPNQPSFRVAKSAAASGNGTILAFNIIRHNVGGHYNTSTGRFTAPVAGSYYFGWQGISGSQTTSNEQNVAIFINGVSINDTRFRGYTSSSGHIKTVVQLSVNDYAEIRLANASVTTYPDAFHNQFMGFLIG